MSRATLTKVLASEVAAAGTFDVDYTSQAQADFVSGQTVTIKVYEREFDCAVSFGASAATITWPSGAPYPLPAGTYYIDFDLVGGDPLSSDAAAATNIAAVTDSSGGTADGTLAAVTDTSATDQSGPINNNFADLADKYNTLLANMKAAGLMEPD